MKDCLVTTLKGSVDNQNLPVLGKAKVIQVNNTKGFQVGIPANGSVKIKADKAFTATINNVTETVPANTEHTVENPFNTDAIVLINGQENNTIFYIDKYGYYFNGYDKQGNAAALQANLEDFTYMTKINFQGVNTKLTGNIKLSDFKDTTEIYLYPGDDNTKVSFALDIADADLTKLSSLTLGRRIIAFGDINGVSFPLIQTLELAYQEQVTLNVETLNAPAITILNTTANPSITGDLKTWALAMWNSGNGRTSGFCKVSYVDGQGTKSGVTWNGQDLYVASGAYQPRIHFSASGVGISSSDTPPSSFVSE